MTVAARPTAPDREPAPRRRVVDEIAARRRADLGRARCDRPGRPGRRRRPRRARSSSAWPRPACTSSPRSSAPRRPPGASPARTRTSSRGRAPTRPAAPRRSRCCASRTGSAARSTTCARVRAAVGIPVLAKEFVVDARQLPGAAGRRRRRRAAARGPPPGATPGAPRRAGAGLGLEPLVEAHDERELRRRARHGRAAHRHQQPRPADARRRHEPGRRGCAPSSRTTGSSSPNRASATRPSSVAGAPSASMARSSARRSCAAPIASAAVRSFVAAGRPPDDPANVARRPFVKICGVTDRGRRPRRGPRRGRRHRAQPGRRDAAGADGRRGRRSRRASSARPRPPVARPRIVAITADADAALVAELVARRRPGRDPGQRPLSRRTCSPPGRAPAWKALHLPADRRRRRGGRRSSDRRGRSSTPVSSGSSSTPPVAPIPVAPVSAPTPARPRRSPGRCRSPWPAASPRPTSPRPCASIAAVGVDVASGVEAPRVDGERPRKDPLRVALFVKRARAARDDRPNAPFGPTPVHAGLLDADGAGRWGMERDFGGRYVPETLMAALVQLETAYDALRHDPAFWADLRELLERFAGRPTALYRADRLAAAVEGETARLVGRSVRRRAARCASTSSARTSPTRARTRSTTPSGRRCSRAGWARPGSSPRPAPASTASRRRPPVRCSTCRASCTWAPRTSSARGRTCCACAPSGPRSAASRPARPRSRTRSTRRCATG